MYGRSPAGRDDWIGLLPGRDGRYHPEKDVWRGSGTPLTAKHRWRQLVALILGTDVPSETDHLVEAAGALMDRSCQSSPLDGGLRAHVLFAVRLGEGGKARNSLP